MWCEAAGINRHDLLAASRICGRIARTLLAQGPDWLRKRRIAGRQRPGDTPAVSALFWCPTWTPLRLSVAPGRTSRSDPVAPGLQIFHRGENFSFLPLPAVFRHRAETFLTRGRGARNRSRAHPACPCTQAFRLINGGCRENSAAFLQEFRSKSCGCDRICTDSGGSWDLRTTANRL